MNYARLICQLDDLDYPVKEWAFRLRSTDQSVVWNGESFVGAIDGVTIELDDSTGSGLRRIQVVVTGPTTVLRTCDVSMWWMATAGKDARYVWLYPVGGDHGNAWVFPEWITPSSTAVPVPQDRLPESAPSGAVHANQLAVTYANGGSLTAGNFSFYGADFDPYREKVTRSLKPIDYGLSEISGLETFYPTRSRPLFHSKHGDLQMPWASIITFLLSFVLSKKSGKSTSAAALTGLAAAGATYLLADPSNPSNLFGIGVDSQSTSPGKPEPVVTTPSGSTGASSLGQAIGGAVNGVGNVISNMGPGTAALVGGAAGLTLAGKGNWLLWGGLALGAILLLKD